MAQVIADKKKEKSLQNESASMHGVDSSMETKGIERREGETKRDEEKQRLFKQFFDAKSSVCFKAWGRGEKEESCIFMITMLIISTHHPYHSDAAEDGLYKKQNSFENRIYAVNGWVRVRGERNLHLDWRMISRSGERWDGESRGMKKGVSFSRFLSSLADSPSPARYILHSFVLLSCSPPFIPFIEKSSLGGWWAGIIRSRQLCKCS